FCRHRHHECGLCESIRGQRCGDCDDPVDIAVEQPAQLPPQVRAVASAVCDDHSEPEALRLRLDPGDDVCVVRVPEVRGEHPEQAGAACTAAVAETPCRAVHPLPGP